MTLTVGKKSEKASEDAHGETAESTEKGSVSETSTDEKGLTEDISCQQNSSSEGDYSCSESGHCGFPQSLLLFAQLTVF